jgi:hypothetical protein
MHILNCLSFRGYIQYCSSFSTVLGDLGPFRLELSRLYCTFHNKTASELLYDWRFTANQFALAPSPLRLTTNIFITEPLRSQSLCKILSGPCQTSGG